MPTRPMPSSPITITFVLRHLERDWPDIASLTEADIDRAPHRFQGGRNSWIAQGYVRLKDSLERRGHRVRVASRIPDDGIAIVHRDDANDWRAGRAGAYLVVVRADRAPVFACDLAIAQNGTALRRGERFVPLWPQPGLRARDESRGERLGRLVYQGRVSRLPAWTRERAFLSALAARGISFEARESGWGDYRRADVALAVREDSATMLSTKPATKVTNAWLAGVPLLATPEPAYAEVARADRDFIEVGSARDVIAAIDRLRAAPDLARSLVRNGRDRARDYDVEAVRSRWLALFDEEILPAARALPKRTGAGRHAWYLGAHVAQKCASRAFKARVGAERWLMRVDRARVSLLQAVRRQVAALGQPDSTAVQGPESTFR